MCSWQGVRNIRRAAEFCVTCSRCMSDWCRYYYNSLISLLLWPVPVFYCIYSEVTPYTTDYTVLHITCPTCVADLLASVMFASSVTSKYFYIVVMLYSVVANLYGHLVIYVVFCKEDFDFRIIFINLKRTSAHPVRYTCNSVVDTGDRFLYSCCIVCTL